MLISSYDQFNALKVLKENLQNVDLIKLLSGFKPEDANNYNIAKWLIEALERNVSSKYDRITISDEKKFDIVSGAHRYEQRATRAIKSFLDAIGKSITDKELQKFMDHLSAKIKLERIQNSEDTTTIIKIVQGKDIRYWYSPKRVLKKLGTELYKSCLNIDERNDFLDFFSINKSVSLIIVLENDKLIARALLWKLDECDANYEWFLDRCYSHYKSEDYLIREWLKTKYNNLYFKNSKLNIPGMLVKLDNAISANYPFLDTLQSLYIKKEGNKLINEGFLSNISLKYSEVEGSKVRKIISSKKDMIEFELKNIIGKRTAVDDDNLKYEKTERYVTVVGLGFNPQIGKFAAEKNLIATISRNYQKEGDMLKWEWQTKLDKENWVSTEKIKIKSSLNAKLQPIYWLKKEDAVNCIDGSVTYKHLAIKMYNVKPLIDSTWKRIKYSKFLFGKNSKFDAIMSCLVYEDGPWLSELDAEILGITKDIENYEIGFLDPLSSRQLYRINIDTIAKYCEDKSLINLRKLLSEKLRLLNK